MLIAQLWEPDCISKTPDMIQTMLDAIQRTVYIGNKQAIIILRQNIYNSIITIMTPARICLMNVCIFITVTLSVKLFHSDLKMMHKSVEISRKLSFVMIIK